MRRARGAKNPETEDLDLAPMLAMIVSLIPILLMAFSFYHTAVVETRVPVPSAKAKPKADERQLRVFLEIDAKRQVRFEVKQKSRVIAQERVASAGGRLDLEKLTVAAKKLRRNFPQVSKLEIVPAEEMSYSEVIETMDGVKKMEKDDELYEEVVFSNIFKG